MKNCQASSLCAWVPSRARSSTCLSAIFVELSLGKPQILIDKYYDEAIEEFRNFMFDYIYCSPQLTVEHNKAEHVVMTLMDLYMAQPQLLPKEYSEIAERFGLGQTVVDFVGGLTDAGAVQLFNKHYIPII